MVAENLKRAVRSLSNEQLLEDIEYRTWRLTRDPHGFYGLDEYPIEMMQHDREMRDELWGEALRRMQGDLTND